MIIPKIIIFDQSNTPNHMQGPFKTKKLILWTTAHSLLFRASNSNNPVVKNHVNMESSNGTLNLNSNIAEIFKLENQ